MHKVYKVRSEQAEADNRGRTFLIRLRIYDVQKRCSPTDDRITNITLEGLTSAGIRLRKISIHICFHVEV